MAERDKIAADLEAQIDLPPPVHVRNINIDTHVGRAPQRPYALLEDQLASIRTGWADAAALKESLKGAPEAHGLPDGAPNPNEVKEEAGGLVRYVVDGAVAREYFARDGAIKERVTFARRGVALSQEGARIASESGTPTDYWNGFTWLREGYKPERDFPVMLHGSAAAEGLVFEQDASPTDAARIRHDVAQLDLTTARLPVEPAAPRASRKEDK